MLYSCNRANIGIKRILTCPMISKRHSLCSRLAGKVDSQQTDEETDEVTTKVKDISKQC